MIRKMKPTLQEKGSIYKAKPTASSERYAEETNHRPSNPHCKYSFFYVYIYSPTVLKLSYYKKSLINFRFIIICLRSKQFLSIQTISTSDCLHRAAFSFVILPCQPKDSVSRLGSIKSLCYTIRPYCVIYYSVFLCTGVLL